MGLSDIMAMLMQHGVSPAGAPSTPAPAAPSSTSGSMLPGTDLQAQQPLAHMNTPSLGGLAAQMPQLSNRPTLASSLGAMLQSHAAPDPGVQIAPLNYGLTPQSNGLHALLQQILGQ